LDDSVQFTRGQRALTHCCLGNYRGRRYGRMPESRVHQQCGAHDLRCGVQDPARPRLFAATTSKLSLAGILGVLSLASGLLVSCGSGHAVQGKPTPARSTAPARSSTEPSGRSKITRAQALTFAHIVNLTAADIPGAKIAQKRNYADAGEQRELDGCEGTRRQTRKLVEARSPQLTRGEELEKEEIRSSVTVLADNRQAAPELSPLKSRGVRECVAHVLTGRFADKSIRDAHWGQFTVSELPVQALGADGTIGIRVATTLNLSFSEVSVPIYVDMLGFTSGPVGVALSAVSVTQPVPATTEQRLLSLLLTRAEARPLM
jgi:hypothetical protein